MRAAARQRDLQASDTVWGVCDNARVPRGGPGGRRVGVLRYRTESGDRRFWTATEIIQGKSIQRVTHPFFVIFPIALATGALVLDILSRLGLSGAPLAGSYAMWGAVGGAALSILTGLVDRSLMRRGSRIRKVATRHMAIQLTATAFFLVDAIVRWSDRGAAKAHPLWLVLDVLGVATVILGGDVGAQMVFQMGHRVRGAGEVPAGPDLTAPDQVTTT